MRPPVPFESAPGTLDSAEGELLEPESRSQAGEEMRHGPRSPSPVVSRNRVTDARQTEMTRVNSQKTPFTAQ